MTGSELIFKGKPEHKAFFFEYAVCAFLCMFMIGLPMLLLRFLRTITEEWTIDTRRVEFSRGILGKRVDSLELWRIRDVIYSQSLLQRMLGHATITVISTDASSPVLAMTGLADAKRIHSELRNAVDSSRAGTSTRIVA